MVQIEEINDSILEVKEQSTNLKRLFKNFLEQFKTMLKYLISNETEIIDITNLKPIHIVYKKLQYNYEILKSKFKLNDFDLDGDVLIDDEELGIKVIIGFIQETKVYELKGIIDKKKIKFF